MFSSLKGKSVIVTGGSKGIGRGIATVFARHGAKVTIAARDESALVKAAAEIEGDVRYEICDVSDWDNMRDMVDSVAKAQGGVDVMCANAGTFPETKIVDMDPAEWDRVMAINLRSSFLSVKASIPHFEKAGKGRVVLISSVTGPLVGSPGWSHYGASKAGQLGFLKSAALELARYNTTINAVMPGNVYTDAFEADMGRAYLDNMAASIPLKRLADVEEIGHAALFFASDQAAYITGQQIVVDGGQTLPETPESLSQI